jgi:hypothetical protein
LQVSASDALNKTLTYTATNLPSGLSIASTTGLISGTISAGTDAHSPYAVTVTTTDSSGNSATQNFNWTVTPVGLVNPGPQASVDGKAVSVQLHGSSGATYTATGLPSGVSINSSTGLISGTLASNADTSSPYVVTATATLGSHSISQTFVLTVTPVGLAAVNTQTNTEGDTVSLQLQGLSSGGTLTYSASGLPNGLSLNSTTGLITGTIAAGDAANGPYTVDAAVSNGNVSASQTFTWNVNPVVNLTAPADQNNKEGDNVSLQISATDSKHATLTYSATGLPAALSISSSTGLISGSISSGDAANGPYTVTVTGSDSTYSSSIAFTWNVTHTDTTALTMTNPGTQTNVAGDSVNLQINASDPDGIDTLTYSATGLPDGVVIDPSSGLISGTMADDAERSTPYQVTVAAADGNGQTISQTFNWVVNAPVIVDPPSPISAIEGQDTCSITVATFTTADLNSQAGAFTATINWGDGSSDVGVVSGSNGSFTVTDDHTYAEKGSDTVTITVTDNITGYSSTDTTTATVTDAPLNLTGGFQLGTIQQQSSTLTLATFTDGNPNASLSDYTATINWGDGSGTQTATVSDTGNGLFTVSGSHAYAQNGTDTATITVTDVDGSTATATSTVVVGQLYAGIQSNLTVASFTDTNTSAPASSFTATINWGDGNQSNGTVTGGNGTYNVQGTHTYAQDSSGGTYTVTVTVSDTGGDTLTSSSTVAVVRPPMRLNAGNVETTLTGLSLSNVQVAEFTEPDVSDGTGEFSATITWGDNSSSNGTIQELSPGLFAVIGSHTYSVAGEYNASVAVSQGWNAMATAAEKSLKVDAGNDQAVIQGPKAVPGNSMYTFTITNPSMVSEADQLVSLTISTPGGSQAQAFAYNAIRTSRTTPTLQFNVYFYNKPGLLNITAKFKKAAPTTFSVFVVPVTVADLPGGSFTPSEKTFDDPNMQPKIPNLTFPYMMKGLASAPPGKAGFTWNARVTLSPQNSGWLSDIEVGFVQHIYVQTLYGYYGQVDGEDKYLVSNMEGHKPPYLDKVTDKVNQSPAGSPFYSIRTPGTNVPAIFTGSRQDNSAIIGSLDTPEAVVPWNLFYTKSQNPANLLKPFAQKIAFDFYFTLDVVAHIAGNGAYSNTYWPQATMNWQFEGERLLDSSAATLPWKGKGFSYVTAVPVWFGFNLDSAFWRPVGPYIIPSFTWPILPIPFAIPEATVPPIANFVYAQAIYSPQSS